jgi:DNA polymerase-2
VTRVHGFIVSAWEERQPRRGAAPRVLATGRLEDGRSFAIVRSAAAPALYVAPSDAARALELLAGVRGASIDPSPWSDLAGAPLARIALSHGGLEPAARHLVARGIEVPHRERADAHLALGISGPVEIHGEPIPGRRVDAVFLDPELSPAKEVVPLEWLALDVETDRAETVVAVSLAGAGGAGEILFLGPALASDTVTSFSTEEALLRALARRLLQRDPDVITGWNVVDFDLRVLAKRFAACGVPFDVGRTAEGATLREREGRRALAEVPGRAVMDALRLVRSSGERFSEQTLEAVARAVLGEGKTVALRGRAKLEELSRLRREEPEKFCAYCLRDSELVLRILAKTGLDALTAKRAALTGVSLDLAWTSIPAFERIYAAELRERRVVPPERDDRKVSGAAGGTVLEAAAGLFPNALVFDFRSLYPSLIRTFNIDPLAHARAEAAPRADDLVAPNGARFERRPGALPGIIARYAAEREAALTAGDETAAHVYKILQNSFYGVLGAEGCRYARTELAGAITSFGKRFLTEARDWFEASGHRVLYGDTDSVFVLSELGDAADFAALTAFGLSAADALNRHLEERIAREYGVQSHLRIRCEKAYRRFLIPRQERRGRRRARPRQGVRRAQARSRRERRGRDPRDGERAQRLHAARAAVPEGAAREGVRGRRGGRPVRLLPGTRGADGARRARRRAGLRQVPAAPRPRLRFADAPGARRADAGVGRAAGPGVLRDDARRRRASRRAQRRPPRLRALPRPAAFAHRAVDRRRPRLRRGRVVRGGEAARAVRVVRRPAMVPHSASPKRARRPGAAHRLEEIPCDS